MNKKENKKILKPFLKDLPKNGTSYFQILDSSQTKTMRSGLVSLKNNESVGEHTTSDYEEMLVIIKGKGEVDINNSKKKFEISKGQIAYIPPQTIHNVKNINKTLLQYIYIVAKTK